MPTIDEYRQRLGRKPQWDPANEQYRLRAVLPREIVRVDTEWARGAQLDQGKTGACTGFGWVDFFAAKPEPVLAGALDTNVYALGYYAENTQNDNIPGTFDPATGKEDTGSTVLAGAKVGKKRGLLDSYHWAASVDDIIDAVVSTGPVVVGTDWTTNMFEPDDEGLLDTGGNVEGGHCYAIVGVYFAKQFKSGPKDVFKIQNSWGSSWGIGGCAYVEIPAWAKIYADQGEACLARKLAAQPTPTPSPTPTPTPSPSPDPGAAPFPQADPRVAQEILHQAARHHEDPSAWMNHHFLSHFHLR